jgi:Uma2 family endonuclease
MNAPILASQWPKAKFTVTQIWALIEKGLVNADAKFELIDGGIRDMSPKGPLHEGIRRIINRWIRTLPRELDDLAETTLYLDEANFVEPDYILIRRAVSTEEMKASDVLLAIEVADSSWEYDAGEKAARYAAHGVQEYWVVQASTGMTRVHRGPGASGWADTRDVSAGETLVPLCAPDTPLTLK